MTDCRLGSKRYCLDVLDGQQFVYLNSLLWRLSTKILNNTYQTICNYWRVGKNCGKNWACNENVTFRWCDITVESNLVGAASSFKFQSLWKCWFKLWNVCKQICIKMKYTKHKCIQMHSEAEQNIEWFRSLRWSSLEAELSQTIT